MIKRESSQMRKDTFLSGYGILQELSGHVLYIHRIRTSTERHVGGIQGLSLIHISTMSDGIHGDYHHETLEELRDREKNISATGKRNVLSMYPIRW